MIEQLCVERLDKRQHNRHEFDCGVEVLNLYLKERANREQNENLNVTYVATNSENTENKSIFGYYTISTSNLSFASLPEKLLKRIPSTYPIPTIRLGRLARDIRYSGIGRYLLFDCLYRVFQLSKATGIRGIEVDAKDQYAKQFYEKYGFVALLDDPQGLFLPIKVIKNLCISSNHQQ